MGVGVGTGVGATGGVIVSDGVVVVVLGTAVPPHCFEGAVIVWPDTIEP